MTSTARHRQFFLFAAAFNFAVAAGLGVMPGVLFPLLDMPAPQERLTFDLFVGVVAIFGLQFLIVAGSPDTRRALIAVGAVAKTAVFVTVTAHWLWIGDASAKLVLLGVVDLVFAVLFIMVLVQQRAAEQ